MTLDRVESYSDVNLKAATKQDRVWAPVSVTDEGNVHALYTGLAICTLIEEATPRPTILDTVVAALSTFIDNPDRLVFFTGRAVSGAANIFCPELSDAVRRIVSQN